MNDRSAIPVLKQYFDTQTGENHHMTVAVARGLLASGAGGAQPFKRGARP